MQRKKSSLNWQMMLDAARTAKSAYIAVALRFYSIFNVFHGMVVILYSSVLAVAVASFAEHKNMRWRGWRTLYSHRHSSPLEIDKQSIKNCRLFVEIWKKNVCFDALVQFEMDTQMRVRIKVNQNSIVLFCCCFDRSVLFSIYRLRNHVRKSLCSVLDAYLHTCRLQIVFNSVCLLFFFALFCSWHFILWNKFVVVATAVECWRWLYVQRTHLSGRQIIYLAIPGNFLLLLFVQQYSCAMNGWRAKQKKKSFVADVSASLAKWFLPHERFRNRRTCSGQSEIILICIFRRFWWLNKFNRSRNGLVEKLKVKFQSVLVFV